MAEKTGIRWTDTTENPIRVRNPKTGKFGGFWCVKISPGCTNCYAAREVARARWGEPVPYVDGPNRPDLYLEQSILDGWARKTKPCRRFVSSMTDIFASFVPLEWKLAILDAQLNAPRQTFLNLTKRTWGMLSAISTWMGLRSLNQAPSNIWPGFSAENQEWFDRRWAEARPLAPLGYLVWVSIEPMIGPVRLPADYLSLGERAWVVVGGESGPHARPMHPQWARDLRAQCLEAGVPFFFKQWGEMLPGEMDPAAAGQMLPWRNWQDGSRSWLMSELGQENLPTVTYLKTGKKRAGYLLDGQEWSQFPQAGA